MRRRRGSLVVAGVAGALALAALLPGTRAVVPAHPGPEVMAPTGPVVEVAVAPPAWPAAAADAPATLLLPDGTQVPALNGAHGVPPLSVAWPRGVPYAGIVGVERSDAGVDWYVHGNGIRSTTELRWREDLGRYDALTRIGQPGPVPPAVTAPGETTPPVRAVIGENR